MMTEEKEFVRRHKNENEKQPHSLHNQTVKTQSAPSSPSPLQLSEMWKFWIADNDMFSSVAWLHLSACSWGVEALVFGPSFQEHYIWKMQWRIFFFFLEDGMTWLHPHGGYAESYWGMCSDEPTFKLGKGLISFCRFMFHFKAISQKCIKGITHQLKHDLDQSWKSQLECLLTQHLWRLASIDWLQIARLHWTIVGQIWPQSLQQHKPPGNIISANHNSFIIQFIFLYTTIYNTNCL